MTQAFRDHEMAMMNPPYRDADAVSEPCDRCHQELDDVATKIKGDGRLAGYTLYLCSDCAVTVERCDGCGLVRCACQ